MDEDIAVISHETTEDKPTTPMALGGSRFRRKPIISTDISSPLIIQANHEMDIESNPLFDSQDSISVYDSVDSIMSPPQYESSASTTSATSSRRTLTARTSSGKSIVISKKAPWKAVLKAQEKRTAAREHKEAYYGVDIHGLLDNIEGQTQQSLVRESSLIYISKLTADPMNIPQILVRTYGPINIARQSLSIYSVTNASIAISCVG